MPRKAKVGATRDSYVYCLTVPASLKAQFDEFLARQNRKAPEVLRLMMRYIIQDEMPSDVRRWIAEQTGTYAAGGPKKGIEVRFTPSEFQGIVTRAEAEGCSPQQWVVNGVRGSLMCDPQPAMEATKALWESSRQLRESGQRLNKFAKMLNSVSVDFLSATFSTEKIKIVEDYIHRHTDKVEAVLDASLSRWGIQVKDGAGGAGGRHGKKP